MRNQILPFAMLSLAALLLQGCNSVPDPEPIDLGFRYPHTRGYVFSELLASAKRKWRIESSDEATGKIVTSWDVNLHGMNTFGRRHRLTLQVDGSPGEGYTVSAFQETEQNTNSLNPTSRAEADWDAIVSDGALAHQFLIGFHRHMTPEETWKEEGER
jgi:hypothetical protein